MLPHPEGCCGLGSSLGSWGTERRVIGSELEEDSLGVSIRSVFSPDFDLRDSIIILWCSMVFSCLLESFTYFAMALYSSCNSSYSRVF